MKSTKVLASLVVLAIVATLTACANQMEPAKQALDEISNLVTMTTADGARYVPDEMGSVQKKLADLQSAYDKKDYAAVLANAPAVLADAKNLAADAAAKKGEIAKALDTEWSAFVASLPQWIADVKNRVDELSKAKRVPKDVDLPSAKEALADATDGWGRAQSAMEAGEINNAIATAKDVKIRTKAAAGALKLELPETDR
ncbi:MAG TPA: hypothetical protein VGL34_03760 [Steroidobacteraceae bacterium]|jgi:hypothetical protein